MTTRTRTSKKTGPKAASKTTPKVTPKAAPKALPEVAAAPTVTPKALPEVAAAPKAETVAAPKVVALAVVEEAVEEAAAVEASVPAAVEASIPVAVEKPAAAKTAGNYDDFAAVQKDGVDAFVRAGELMAKGTEELTRTCFGLCQEAAAANADAVAAMLAVKSLDELVGLQNELARKAFDRSVAESTRLSEMSIKIANEAFEPIQTQLTVAVEKALKPLAA